MATTSTPADSLVSLAEREPRCRMRNRLNDPCPNPSVDPDRKAVQICARHMGEVIALYREHLAKTATHQKD